MNQIDRNNNFDLIRLFAAVQVLVFHCFTHFKIETPFLDIIKHFPGVPIFFALSGFLIPMSYQNSRANLKKYFFNRFIRIYPALWVCLLITIVLLFSFNALHFSDLWKLDFWAWILAQITFFQFYDNNLVQDWGVGSPNGSLWSIAIELQFYVFVPILFGLISKIKSKTSINILLLILYLFSITFHDNIFKAVWWCCVNVPGTPKFFLDYLFIDDIIGIFLFSYLHYFLIGIFVYINFDLLKSMFSNRFLFWFAAYIIYVSVFVYTLNCYKPSNKNIHDHISVILLAFVCFSFAFSNIHLGKKLIKENDISYGVYIYQMLIINSIYYLLHSFWAMLFTCVSTVILAYLSWFYVEKPLIKKKK